MDDAKVFEENTSTSSPDYSIGTVVVDVDNEAEVFATGADGVNFRTVGWLKAAVFMLKMTVSLWRSKYVTKTSD